MNPRLFCLVVLISMFTMRAADSNPELQSFIKKLRYEGEIKIENKTDRLLPVLLTYAMGESISSESLLVDSHSIKTIARTGAYLVAIEVQGQAEISPLINGQGKLKIQLTDTQQPFLSCGYYPFTFKTPFFTLEQLTDKMVPHKTRAFRKDFNTTCRYVDLIGKHEGVSIDDGDNQRQKLYEKNNLPRLLKKKPGLLDGPSRIPLITHKIWVTGDDNPKAPPAVYIKWLENSIAHNPPADGWTHYFWIESKQKLPQFAQLLENHPTIILRELSELDTSLFVTGDQYKKAIAGHRFGTAADILRLELLRLFGGFYMDTDYELFQSLCIYSKAYDMVVGLECNSPYIGNACIGARPCHPVIQKMLTMVKSNLGKTPPRYVKKVRGQKFRTLIETGPALFTIAFALKGGCDGFTDIVLPPQILYPAQSNIYPSKEIVRAGGKIPPQAIGAHYWNISWMNPALGGRS